MELSFVYELNGIFNEFSLNSILYEYFSKIIIYEMKLVIKIININDPNNFIIFDIYHPHLHGKYLFGINNGLIRYNIYNNNKTIIDTTSTRCFYNENSIISIYYRQCVKLLDMDNPLRYILNIYSLEEFTNETNGYIHKYDNNLLICVSGYSCNILSVFDIITNKVKLRRKINDKYHVHGNLLIYDIDSDSDDSDVDFDNSGIMIYNLISYTFVSKFSISIDVKILLYFNGLLYFGNTDIPGQLHILNLNGITLKIINASSTSYIDFVSIVGKRDPPLNNKLFIMNNYSDTFLVDNDSITELDNSEIKIINVGEDCFGNLLLSNRTKSFMLIDDKIIKIEN